jgi:hypothetical protein
MLKPDPTEAQLQNIPVPQVASEAHKRRLKLVLLDARRSAWWGTLLVILPAVFLTTVFLQYGLGLGPFLDPMDKFLLAPIRHSGHRWIEPLLLFVLPLVALVANVLSVTHFSVAPSGDEFVFTVAVKKRWWNWVIIVLSGIIVTVIFLYAVKGDR